MTSTPVLSPRAAHSRGLQATALAGLVLMAMLWGSTFFSIKALVAHIPVMDMLAVRFAIAAVAIGALGWRHWRMSRRTMWQGAWLGLVYGLAQVFQTFGLAHTSASVSGFVTGLYVVFTPFAAAALLRERVPAPTWVAVVLATLGLGVLTLNLSTGLRIGTGEILTLISALLYTAHIVSVDKFSTQENALSLTNAQIVVVTLLCALAALPGGIALPRTGADWAWLLYLALIAGAIPIFMQIWAQSIIESTTAAVIMAGEPVWAAVFAVLFGGEHVTWQMVVGGLAMFAAMLIVTLSPRLKRPFRPLRRTRIEARATGAE